MRTRSADFWLTVSLMFAALCLLGVGVAHLGYTRAQAAYQSHLRTVVFKPGTDTAGTYAGYVATVNRRLYLQTVVGGVAALAVVNVLVQVVRRRNERLRLAPAEAASE